ncbi:MAG TPA: TetR/AcrR family transcriptional regulator [Phycisphaerales bacterium]|nr:TetR/AcrR family transcriptional regulator [Phycisphaerales bacterium]
MDSDAAAMLRDRMLDAAEAVVVRHGIANLTFEAVAAEAGMSKGGLLHYFPTKDRLIEALVTRCAEGWRKCVFQSLEQTPEGYGRMAKALLRSLADTEGWTEQCQRSSAASFVALAQNPRLIEPMRVVYNELRAELAKDGLGAGIGETVLVAMDGLWLNRVLGLAPVDRERINRIRLALDALITLAQETDNRAMLGENKKRAATRQGSRRAPRARRSS